MLHNCAALYYNTESLRITLPGSAGPRVRLQLMPGTGLTCGCFHLQCAGCLTVEAPTPDRDDACARHGQGSAHFRVESMIRARARPRSRVTATVTARVTATATATARVTRSFRMAARGHQTSRRRGECGDPRNGPFLPMDARVEADMVRKAANSDSLCCLQLGSGLESVSC